MDRRGHDRLDQRVPARRADHRQHVALGRGIDADVAGDEFGRVLELAQRLVGRHQHGKLPWRWWCGAFRRS